MVKLGTARARRDEADGAVDVLVSHLAAGLASAAFADMELSSRLGDIGDVLTPLFVPSIAPIRPTATIATTATTASTGTTAAATNAAVAAVSGDVNQESAAAAARAVMLARAIPVHAVILAMRSPVVAQALKGRRLRMRITGVPPDVLRAVVEYVYTGECELENEGYSELQRLGQLAHAAQLLGMDHLLGECLRDLAVAQLTVADAICLHGLIVTLPAKLVDAISFHWKSFMRRHYEDFIRMAANGEIHTGYEPERADMHVRIRTGDVIALLSALPQDGGTAAEQVVRTACHLYIETNAYAVLMSPHFLRSSVDSLRVVLTSRTLQVKEKLLFQAVLQWILIDPASREAECTELMTHINLDKVPSRLLLEAKRQGFEFPDKAYKAALVKHHRSRHVRDVAYRYNPRLTAINMHSTKRPGKDLRALRGGVRSHRNARDVISASSSSSSLEELARFQQTVLNSLKPSEARANRATTAGAGDDGESSSAAPLSLSRSNSFDNTSIASSTASQQPSPNHPLLRGAGSSLSRAWRQNSYVSLVKRVRKQNHVRARGTRPSGLGGGGGGGSGETTVRHTPQPPPGRSLGRSVSARRVRTRAPPS
ncbi:uncharacterized protein AMSG_09812 [Thecamonas trahens ATCC 50062]|uniref:BTB domain-containing protein n=1 Tax=Thecamonas trahens ATCC 50062 TaxID=461836 RepID=A0A0L0DP96_THETB|nr:hypothetical protein AMSG_09812 [Thecamonas trahens ATCC 50062]KNC53861.1 hypothetical protein AMSG_09812 [Thecamonas trahens ATCC 50062]|eukprot:XP_013754241.1 hypothetical protein AMSG_09812 [Thecamonas trahens ATCC 50062]